MRKLAVLLFMVVSSVNSQSLKKDFLTFNVDEENKEYFVKVGDIGNDKSQVVVEIKCFVTLSNSKKETRAVEILTVTQKINNGGNVFFGGELYEGDYLISLSYTEKGKRITKTMEKSVKKSWFSYLWY